MRGTTQSRTRLTGLLVFVLAMAAVARAEGQRLMPQIDGEWWTVAGDPDLGDLTSPKQQPVDFAIWQAAEYCLVRMPLAFSPRRAGVVRIVLDIPPPIRIAPMWAK